VKVWIFCIAGLRPRGRAA